MVAQLAAATLDGVHQIQRRMPADQRELCDVHASRYH
jgi:hypothetical protein